MDDIRVLAFTASTKRPLLLRLCMMQMQMQTYPCSHGVFINSKDYESPTDKYNYCCLINDIKISKGSYVKVSYGKQGHQHFNHMAALQQFDLDNFDLFIKIDDDDIYRSDYVKNVVEDYKKNKWDFSGVSSTWVINREHLQIRENVSFKKHKDNLHNHPLDFAMPGTFAFSKAAIDFLIQNGKNHQWKGAYEDPVWLKWMIDSSDIQCLVRDKSDYTYVVHGYNSSNTRVT